MRVLYLILAVIGAIVPYVFFAQHFLVQGLSLSAFVGGLFANGAAGGFSADLLITSLVFWVAITRERSAGRGPSPILFVALNLLIGLSCALPAYLFVREGGKTSS